MRVGEQGPRRHRGLPTAPPAVTQAPLRNPVIRPTAYRAEKSFRPPQPDKIIAARRLVREPIAKLQHRAWILRHDPATTNCATGVKCIALFLKIEQTVGSFAQLDPSFAVGAWKPL